MSEINRLKRSKTTAGSVSNARDSFQQTDSLNRSHSVRKVEGSGSLRYAYSGSSAEGEEKVPSQSYYESKALPTPPRKKSTPLASFDEEDWESAVDESYKRGKFCDRDEQSLAMDVEHKTIQPSVSSRLLPRSKAARGI